MLENIDRVQLVVQDRAATAASWKALLGSEVVREDTVKALGAKRTVIGLGHAEVELLEPDGAGPVADFMAESGRGGLFAAGFSTNDIQAVRNQLASRGVSFAEEGDQIFLPPGAVEGKGFRAVITPATTRPKVGIMNRLHEVSFLVDDPEKSAASLVETLGIDKNFGATQSDVFGFEGIHVYLTGKKDDDIETINPVDRDKAMGRFFDRRGSSLYMAFGETDDIEGVRARAMEHAPADWTGPKEGPIGSIFLHPKALGGVMLGVRKPTAPH